MDLYAFRDEAVVFYVGQSQLAFSQVWDHLKSGFHLPPNASFRRRRSLTMLIHEAERAVKAEDTKLWLENMEE